MRLVLLTLNARARNIMVVVLCACVPVTTLAATYLVCESKVGCYKVPYGVSNTRIVWISPRLHTVKVLTTALL